MFYTFAQLFWLFANPFNCILILLCLAVLLLWSRWQRVGVWVISILVISLLAMAILPLGQWLLSPLNRQFSPFESSGKKIDGIVLLAGDAVNLKASRQMGHPVPGKASDRLVEFMRLAKVYPKAQLLICGGNIEAGTEGHDKRRPEATLIAEYLINQGLSNRRILIEDRSRDTFENALLGQQLAQPSVGQKWLLVTSTWHMPRAVATFQAQNWPIIAAPPGSNKKIIFRLRFNLESGLKALDIAVHEYLGLLAYRLNGRITSVWPAS